MGSASKYRINYITMLPGFSISFYENALFDTIWCSLQATRFMFTEEQAIAELAHRVFLHGNTKVSCKSTRIAAEGEKKKPAIETSVWKSLMAGNPLFQGTFGQMKGR